MRVGWIGFDVSLGEGMGEYVVYPNLFSFFVKKKFENPIKLSFILIPKKKFMKMIFRKLSQTDLDSS